MAAPTAGTGADQDQFWPLPKFYFSVDIGDFTDLAFQEVSGLDIDSDVIEYRHGNSPVHSVIKMPGLMKYSDITLKKGVFTTDNRLYDWISKISLNTYERLTVVIRLLDENTTPQMTWTLTNASQAGSNRLTRFIRETSNRPPVADSEMIRNDT